MLSKMSYNELNYSITSSYVVGSRKSKNGVSDIIVKTFLEKLLISCYKLDPFQYRSARTKLGVVRHCRLVIISFAKLNQSVNFLIFITGTTVLPFSYWDTSFFNLFPKKSFYVKHYHYLFRKLKLAGRKRCY